MRRLFAAIAVCSAVFSLTHFAFCQEFKANVITTTQDGTVNGRVFVSKDRIRMEMEPAVTIARIDKKLLWMLMPQEKIYMEMPMSAENLVTLMNKVPGEISRKSLGNEPVNGMETEKFEVKYKDKDKEETIYVWLSKDLQFPLKSASLDGSWIVEYKDVMPGPQPQEMFELPAGYEKFDYGAAQNQAAGN
jgi:hypothetical protein